MKFRHSYIPIVLSVIASSPASAAPAPACPSPAVIMPAACTANPTAHRHGHVIRLGTADNMASPISSVTSGPPPHPDVQTAPPLSYAQAEDRSEDEEYIDNCLEQYGEPRGINLEGFFQACYDQASDLPWGHICETAFLLCSCEVAGVCTYVSVTRVGLGARIAGVTASCAVVATACKAAGPSK